MSRTGPKTKRKALSLNSKLTKAQVAATVVAGEAATHATIIANLGKVDDWPGLAGWEFLARAMKI